ncbi:hypothetical protein HPULCUR_005018 [Helicostylum pulchrum]|uniref:Uncharacterized protein n=1 Tax=Helicostylum pulchrum TaxID=562976 RepID=A0ABP9XXX9_9FUNG
MKVLNTGLTVLDHGSLIPQGIYTADVDYDTNIVRALIRKGQLAPFYDECFLQLRRSASSPLVPAVCPFCVQPNLGVLYVPPAWSKHYNAFKKRRSDLFIDDNDMNRRKWKLEPDDPDVVLVDRIRPRWEEMLEERRSSAVGTTRRRRVQLNNGEPITGSRRRRRSSRHALSLHHDNSSNNTIYDTFADMDLEDVFVMEAIRLSLVNNNNT